MPKARARRYALFAAASGAILAMPQVATSNDCTVNPYDAYQAAITRGWHFTCNVQVSLPGAVLQQALFVDPPRRRIGCRFTTAPLASPSPPLARMRFFRNPSQSSLRNGWSLSDFQITGGQFSVVRYGPPLEAFFSLDRAGRTFTYRLTSLVLSKPGGNCANVLNEAF